MFGRSENKGQVGIGTLIVFIALVLVAAVAAGLLISVSGDLQDRAQQTGEQAEGEVSNQLNVTQKFGEVDSSGEVEEVRLHVDKSAGAERIDLSRSSLVVFGSSNEVVLEYGGVGLQQNTETISGASIGGTVTVSETPVDSVVTAVDSGDGSTLSVTVSNASAGEITIDSDGDGSLTGPVDIQYRYGTALQQGEFGVRSLTDDDTSIADAGVLNSERDIAEVYYQLNASDAPVKLQPGQEQSVQINVAGGGEKSETLLVPQVVEADSLVEL